MFSEGGVSGNNTGVNIFEDDVGSRDDHVGWGVFCFVLFLAESLFVTFDFEHDIQRAASKVVWVHI